MFGSHNGLLVASYFFLLALSALSLPARAQDAAVVQRLQTHGGLSAAVATKLVTKLSKRMAKSADALVQQSDPLRIAASQALFNTPVPPDTMAAAKMRLRLYAGLNEWALGALFTAKPGAFAACTRDTGATQAECEALVAAAGNTSVAEVRNLAGGPPMAAVAVATVPRAQSGFGAAPAAGGSHFGHFSAASNGSAASTPHAVVAPAAAPTYAAASAKHFGGTAPVAGPHPVHTQQQAGLSQKEAYRLQREAYMARQKTVFEERKQKLDAAASAESAAAAAPAAAKPAPRSNVAAAKPAGAPQPSAAAQEAPAEPAADESVAEAAPAPKSNKPALDNDFLDGLLADPTGGKKK